jgi:hypothetical protein
MAGRSICDAAVVMSRVAAVMSQVATVMHRVAK